ncbi:MAG: hypothetical protein V3T70_11610 [Phycisphaerae bacterium]
MITCVLAQLDPLSRLQSMRRTFNSPESSMPGFTVGASVLITILALFALGFMVTHYLRHAKEMRNASALLFQSVMTACNVPALERVLLHCVARHARSDCPAAMFLAPALYEAEVERWVSGGRLRFAREWVRGRLKRAMPAFFEDGDAAEPSNA